MRANFKRMRAALLALALAAAATTAGAAPLEYVIDPARTRVEFAVRAGLGEVRGRFERPTGRLVVDPDDPRAARVSVAAPVRALNTGDPRRDRVLRGPDWFDAEAHPTLRFRSVTARAQDDRTRIDGELTLRGLTRPAAFESRTEPGPEEDGRPTLRFTAWTTIDRRAFGMTAMRGLAGDQVRVRVEGVAVAR